MISPNQDHQLLRRLSYFEHIVASASVIAGNPPLLFLGNQWNHVVFMNPSTDPALIFFNDCPRISAPHYEIFLSLTYHTSRLENHFSGFFSCLRTHSNLVGRMWLKTCETVNF